MSTWAPHTVGLENNDPGALKSSARARRMSRAHNWGSLGAPRTDIMVAGRHGENRGFQSERETGREKRQPAQY